MRLLITSILIQAVLGQVAPQTKEPPLVSGAGLSLPPEVRPGKERRTVEIAAKTEGKRVDWELPEAIDGYTPVYAEDVFASPDGKTIKFPIPTRPGRYVFRAYSAVKDLGVFSKTVLVIEGAPPAPTPPPTPPQPGDAFKADLAKLVAEASPAERNQVAVFVAAYRAAAKECKGNGNATLEELITLITGIIDDKEQGVGQNVLRPVRDRVRQELARVVPDLESELTDATRTKAADVYTRAADALEGK